MSSTGQGVSSATSAEEITGKTKSYPAEPPDRVVPYLHISAITRYLAIIGVLLAVRLPGIEPSHPGLFYWLSGLGLAANTAFLLAGRKRWPEWGFHLTGLLDILLIGTLVWMTGGTGSPFVALFMLDIMFNGVFYGWLGTLSGAFPSTAALLIIWFAEPDPSGLGPLLIRLGSWAGIGFFAGWVGEREKSDRHSLAGVARRRAQQTGQIRALLDTSAVISSQVEAEALLTTAVTHVKHMADEMWGAPGGGVVTSINLVDVENRELVVRRVAGDHPASEPGTRIPFDSFDESKIEQLLTGKSYVVTGRDSEDLARRFGVKAEASYTIVPIVEHDKVLGVISIRSDDGALPKSSEIELFETIANHVASALLRLTALEEERRGRHEAVALFGLARDLASADTVEHAMRLIVEASRDILEVPVCAAALVNEASHEIDPASWAVAGDTSAELMSRMGPSNVPEISNAVRIRQPIALAAGTEASEQAQTMLRLLGTTFGTLFPITAHERSMGFLIFGARQRSLTIAKWQLGEAISGLASVAIENLLHLLADKAVMAELRELDRVKTELVSTASHELRSPLTSITGYARTLLRPNTQFSPEEREDFLRVIDQQAKQLANLIDELLSVTKTESDRRPLLLERIDLSLLISESVAAARMRSSKHRFEEDIPPSRESMPLVTADVGKLREVITNLVDNAIKYSPDGGTIKVGGAVVEREIRIWVSDDGMGIPESEVALIFNKYYQVEGHSQIAGRGLGLHIVSELVKDHDGTVEVQSVEGRGTTFTVVLPQRRATDSQSASLGRTDAPSKP